MWRFVTKGLANNSYSLSVVCCHKGTSEQELPYSLCWMPGLVVTKGLANKSCMHKIWISKIVTKGLWVCRKGTRRCHKGTCRLMGTFARDSLMVFVSHRLKEPPVAPTSRKILKLFITLQTAQSHPTHSAGQWSANSMLLPTIQLTVSIFTFSHGSDYAFA